MLVRKLSETVLGKKDKVLSCKVPWSPCGVRPIFIEDGVNFEIVENKVQQLSPYPRKWNMTRMNRRILLSGPLGMLETEIPEGIIINELEGMEKNQRILSLSIDPTIYSVVGKYQQKFLKSMMGTLNSELQNNSFGVLTGHCVPLSLLGIGYRASLLEPKLLDLRIGVCHPVLVKVPSDITAQVPFPTRIILSGINIQRVSLFASKIRSLHPPEPYKGKGIYVAAETKRLKKRRQK